MTLSKLCELTVQCPNISQNFGQVIRSARKKQTNNNNKRSFKSVLQEKNKTNKQTKIREVLLHRIYKLDDSVKTV